MCELAVQSMLNEVMARPYVEYLTPLCEYRLSRGHERSVVEEQECTG
jgi:hypothetical protein